MPVSVVLPSSGLHYVAAMHMRDGPCAARVTASMAGGVHACAQSHVDSRCEGAWGSLAFPCAVGGRARRTQLELGAAQRLARLTNQPRALPM
jgi:hypothetical protein